MQPATRTLIDTLAKSLSTPLEEARGLPPQAYLSEEFYELELEHLFRRDWICVGREEEVAQTGDYFTIELAGEPLVVVRGTDNRLRALSNVCRHRYMQVVMGQGNAARLSCPYHGWTYRLDGKLMGATSMAESRILDKENCRLPEFRLETWLGFIFVNLDNDAEALAPRLQELGDRLAPYHIDGMRISSMYDEIWEGNWKLTMENNAEAHHHRTLHPETLQPWMPGDNSHCGEDERDWSLLRTPLMMDLVRAEAPMYADLMERWSADIKPQDREETLTYVIYPSGTIDASPGIVFWKRILPLSIDRTRVMMGALVPEEELNDELSRYNREFFEEINPEDYKATWRLQRTIGSRYAEAGPLSVKEACLFYFQRYLGRRLSNI
ncbi:MAG: aromatic ring-hydroxylating dioxygenase subunit alpha [Gammaproteobacteria bacterium]|nr:aromatic ring-hydroxylating dioxygenase subunit alpha [Gammaproteobacteria bacterium]